MSVTELAQKRDGLIQWISQLTDIKLIALLESVQRSQSKGDWWNDLTEEQIRSIEKGVEDIDAGRTYPSAEAWEKIKHGG